MERIESLPIPQIESMDEEAMKSYMLDVANWIKRLEDTLTEYDPPTTEITTYTPSLTPVGSVAANGTGTEAFAVSGITAGELLVLTDQPAQTSGIVAVGTVASADNEVTITFFNGSGGAITPNGGTFTFFSITEGT